MSLATLDEFLDQKTWPFNAYVDFPGFCSLYVRKGKMLVSIGGEHWICTGLIQIGNIEAEEPGKGAFVELITHLKDRNLAVFVENVHNVRFRRRLLELGFVPVNVESGHHYLWNYEGHLHPHVQTSVG